MIWLFLALGFNVRCADCIIVLRAARYCDSQYPCTIGGSLVKGDWHASNNKHHLTICSSANTNTGRMTCIYFSLAPIPSSLWYFQILPSKSKISSKNKKSFKIDSLKIIERRANNNEGAPVGAAVC